MFGVIICPKCHRARGVSLSTIKAKCPHCGHNIDVSLAKIYHRTDSQEELVLAVQKMTEKLATDIEDYPAEKKRKSKPRTVEGKRGFRSEEDLRYWVKDLSAEKGEFTLQELMLKLSVDEEKAERITRAMMDSGLVYEPGPSRFKPLV
jgi:alkylated DNA repair dioxygenase AlkB